MSRPAESLFNDWCGGTPLLFLTVDRLHTQMRVALTNAATDPTRAAIEAGLSAISRFYLNLTQAKAGGDFNDLASWGHSRVLEVEIKALGESNSK
jgi:hypothetical protein